MRIANPIYDAVFKHLMEDLEIAGGLIGRLLGVKVISLTPLPQEVTDRKAASLATNDWNLRLFRLDFAAEVEWIPGQPHKVLIELQKALAAEAVSRFRNYLGKHYARPPKKSEDLSQKSENLPIIAIYFLGFTLSPDIPKVVRVQRRYLNAVTQEPLPAQVRDGFLEQLTHDAVAVQIPLLDDHAESDLERTLAVFDQRRKASNPHFLLVKEGEEIVPGDPLVKRIVRKLLAVASDAETQAQMDAEDEVVGFFERLEIETRLKEQALRAAEKERQHREDAEARIAELEERLRRLENDK